MPKIVGMPIPNIELKVVLNTRRQRHGTFNILTCCGDQVYYQTSFSHEACSRCSDWLLCQISLYSRHLAVTLTLRGQNTNFGYCRPWNVITDNSWSTCGLNKNILSRSGKNFPIGFARNERHKGRCEWLRGCCLKNTSNIKTATVWPRKCTAQLLDPVNLLCDHWRKTMGGRVKFTFIISVPCYFSCNKD